MSDPIEDLRKLLASIDPAVLAQALPANAIPLVSSITQPICSPAIDGMGVHMSIVEYFKHRYLLIKPLAPASTKSYFDIIAGVKKWLGRTPTIYDVATRINDYLYYRARDVSAMRLKAYRAHLGAILAQAVEDGLIPQLPKIAKITPPDHIVVAFLPEELEKLVEMTFAIGTDGLFVRGAIQLVYDTGCRHRDAMNLTWENVVESTGIITWIVKKTNRRQSALLSDETMQTLKALRRHAYARDKRLVPFDRDRWAWSRIWKRLGKLSGVDTHKRNLQCVRRTGASLVAAAGLNPTQYLGHAPSSVHLAEKFYLDRRINKPAPVSPAPMTPPLNNFNSEGLLTHKTPVRGLLSEFLEYNRHRVHSSANTFADITVSEWFDMMKIECLGNIFGDSASEYASLLHHDGFTNIQIGGKLKALSRFLQWLVERRGCPDDDVVTCLETVSRDNEKWRPPPAHPSRDETY